MTPLLRLKARVRKDKGTTIHGAGYVHGDEVRIANNIGSAATLQIEGVSGGVLLIRFDASGEFAGDTWHATVDEAKEQADFEYELEDDGWTSST